MLNIGLIGTGKWGKNYIKTAQQFPINLIILDRKLFNKTVSSKKLNGLIIATPPDSHIQLAEQALSFGIPCIIEKPLAFSLEEIDKIKQYNDLIIVNYTHLFSNSFQYIKSAAKSINYIYSEGGNNGPSREYSALWDWAPHDLAMGLDLLGKYPNKVEYNETEGGNHHIMLSFSNHIKHRIMVGNAFKKKERYLKVLSGSDVYGYNDLLPRGLSKNSDTIDLANTLPLYNLLNVFIDLIGGKSDYRAGLDLSIKITKILMEIEKTDKVLV